MILKWKRQSVKSTKSCCLLVALENRYSRLRENSFMIFRLVALITLLKNFGISIYYFENPYWIFQTRLQTHLEFTINAVLDWWPLRKCATRVSTWNANFSFIIDAESAKQFSKVHSLNFYQKISTIQTIITETAISFNVPSKDITLT